MLLLLDEPWPYQWFILGTSQTEREGFCETQRGNAWKDDDDDETKSSWWIVCSFHSNQPGNCFDGVFSR